MNPGRSHPLSQRAVAAVLALTALGAAPSLRAHHSAAMFDHSRTITIQGTVRSYEWTNPHVWIWVDVPDAKGRVTSWGIESANLSMAARMGLNRRSFTAGDKVTMMINPRVDGKPSGSFRRATFADGHVVEMPSPPGSGAAAPAAAPDKR